MLYVYTGTDREKARGAMAIEIERAQKKAKAHVVRITDVNQAADLSAALQGPGMFGEKQILVLEGVLANEDMRETLLEALPRLAASEEAVFLYEEKPDADTRRKLEKHAETGARHDAPKKAKDNSVFALANALERGDKKALWVGYQSALAKGNAPEALHGILFWGAKRMLLSARKDSPAHRRGEALVAALAELPHEARRRGFELEYALERYLLAVNKI